MTALPGVDVTELSTNKTMCGGDLENLSLFLCGGEA